ncbi:MAG: hypothetical protein HY225_01630 [Candidatus Vogelbacteria bacterium]|nr:hypothetical protein [Candidatus Vogelbacteria bacterium]
MQKKFTARETFAEIQKLKDNEDADILKLLNKEGGPINESLSPELKKTLQGLKRAHDEAKDHTEVQTALDKLRERTSKKPY